jgi:hypothetical protein
MAFQPLIKHSTTEKGGLLTERDVESHVIAPQNSASRLTKKKAMLSSHGDDESFSKLNSFSIQRPLLGIS